jgi:hypothetical protein
MQNELPLMSIASLFNDWLCLGPQQKAGASLTKYKKGSEKVQQLSM